MLREGIELEGKSIDLDGLTDPNCTRIEGIANSETLLSYANAFMGQGETGLAQAREALVQDVGVEAMIDAVGVASTFQRMDRIADATGIPADGPTAIMQKDLARLLGTDKYQSASNTKPASWMQRLLYKLIVIPKMRKMIKEKSDA